MHKPTMTSILFLLITCLMTLSLGLRAGPSCLGQGEDAASLNTDLAPALAATTAEYCYAARKINGPESADYYAIYCEDNRPINTKGVGSFAQDREQHLVNLAASVITAMQDNGFEKVGQFLCYDQDCTVAGYYVFRRAEMAANDPTEYLITSRTDMGAAGIVFTVYEPSAGCMQLEGVTGPSSLEAALREIGYEYEQALPADNTTITKTLFRKLP